MLRSVYHTVLSTYVYKNEYYNKLQYFKCLRTSKVNVRIQRAAMVILNKDNSLRGRCINNLVGV